MTTSIWLRDILSYGLQLAVIVSAGVALAFAFRIREPKVMLAYWRTLLVVCLLLPVCQPWLESRVPAVQSSPLVAGEAASAPEAPAQAVPHAAWPLESLVLLALVIGVGMRALWLTMGAWTLGRLRRTATPLVPLPAAFSQAEERLGVHAGIYVSDRVAGPVTFGVIHPIVIVPPSVVTMPHHVLEAIACHELLHVRRRDWLFEVGEEAVRAIFWFHPAIWWLIDRIQLSREQVVDQAAIHLMKSRDHYLDALLVVALNKSPMSLVPAPLFLRRRLLKRRVAQIMQETTMTTRRLIASLTASTAALALAATVAVRSFPLEAQGQEVAAQEAAGGPIQIVKGGEHLLHASLSEYPRRAIEQRVQGDVLLDIVTDDRGEVSDARVLSGPDELRRAALESVLQWHYSPEALRSTTLQATLRFTLPPANAEYEKHGYAVLAKMEDEEQVKRSQPQHAEHLRAELSKALQDPGASDQQKDEWKRKFVEEAVLLNKMRAENAWKDGAEYTVRLAPRRSLFEGTPRLVRIGAERVTPETMKELVQRAGISIGDQISEGTAKRIEEIARTLDEHLRVSFRGDGNGGLIIMVLTP
jgi:TonB family protein